MGDTPEGEGGGPMEHVEGVKKENKGDGFLCQSGFQLEACQLNFSLVLYEVSRHLHKLATSTLGEFKPCRQPPSSKGVIERGQVFDLLFEKKPDPLPSPFLFRRLCQ